jgi:hypothetical protein
MISYSNKSSTTPPCRAWSIDFWAATRFSQKRTTLPCSTYPNPKKRTYQEVNNGPLWQGGTGKTTRRDTCSPSEVPWRCGTNKSLSYAQDRSKMAETWTKQAAGGRHNNLALEVDGLAPRYHVPTLSRILTPIDRRPCSPRASSSRPLHPQGQQRRRPRRHRLSAAIKLGPLFLFLFFLTHYLVGLHSSTTVLLYKHSSTTVLFS